LRFHFISLYLNYIYFFAEKKKKEESYWRLILPRRITQMAQNTMASLRLEHCTPEDGIWIRTTP